MKYKLFTNTLKNIVWGKKIVVLPLLFLCFSQYFAKADDDVYDAPKPREVKIKQTNTKPAETGKTVPYNEDENSNTRQQSSSNNNNQDYSQYDNGNTYSNDNDYSSNFGYGYSDRIRRFHNPSIQFSYGYNFYNSFYDPYYSYNNFGSYSFTPSWAYSYNDFYNPFWGNSQIIIINDPWMSSWYNTGFYNPYNSWNYYSPSCAAMIYNNAYPYYGSYYDPGRKNVVYAPRTGSYNNTNNGTPGKNYNYNYPSNTNNSGLNNNSQNGTPNKKWNNNNNSNNPNIYKYNKSNDNSGNWNTNHKGNNSNSPPSNNNNWEKNNDNSNSGIKIGSKPK